MIVESALPTSPSRRACMILYGNERHDGNVLFAVRVPRILLAFDHRMIISLTAHRTWADESPSPRSKKVTTEGQGVLL